MSQIASASLFLTLEYSSKTAPVEYAIIYNSNWTEWSTIQDFLVCTDIYLNDPILMLVCKKFQNLEKVVVIHRGE